MTRDLALPRYRIGAVARLTGISTHALRVWERRYGVLSEERSPKGARLYTDEDVARLRLLKRLLEAGHSVSSVYRLSQEELSRIAADYHAPTPPTGPSVPDDVGDSARVTFLDAIESLDVDGAAQSLARASIVYSPRALLTEVVAPILEEVGRRWEAGRFSVAHEHAATAVVRNLLGRMLPVSGAVDTDRPVAIAATLEGELHELGALFAAVVASLHHFRVLYLGPSMPTPDLARLAHESGARVVLLSMVHGASSEPVDELRRALPRDTDLYVGGKGAAQLGDVFSPGVRVVHDLETLDESLRLRVKVLSRGGR